MGYVKTVTFRGKEVTSTWGKRAVYLYLAIMLPISFVLMFVAFALMILLSPVLIPLHYLLKSLGRRGFTRHTATTFDIKVDADGFRKVR